MCSCKHRNADEICRVRCAAAEKFIIKRIMTNFFNYVHASHEMTAHLTRCALAYPADVHQETLF